MRPLGPEKQVGSSQQGSLDVFFNPALQVHSGLKMQLPNKYLKRFFQWSGTHNRVVPIQVLEPGKGPQNQVMSLLPFKSPNGHKLMTTPIKARTSLSLARRLRSHLAHRQRHHPHSFGTGRIDSFELTPGKL
jgi:hypothetical protein